MVFKNNLSVYMYRIFGNCKDIWELPFILQQTQTVFEMFLYTYSWVTLKTIIGFFTRLNLKIQCSINLVW